MDAADILYGVSMGGDGVTKVVSRRLPREVEEGEEGGDTEVVTAAAAPPPFAGLAGDPAEEDAEAAPGPGLIGEEPAASAEPRSSVEAA
jgi:hypothetical protein